MASITQRNRAFLNSAATGNLEGMKKCLAKGAAYDARDERGIIAKSHRLIHASTYEDGTALHIACWAGHERIIEYLAEKHPLLLQAETGWKRTPLFSLAKSTREVSDVCFTNLLWAGAKLSHRDEQRITPLFLLACHKEKLPHLKIGLAWLSIFETLDEIIPLPTSVITLIGNYSNASFTREQKKEVLNLQILREGATPLHRAIQWENTEALRLLRDAGTDLSLKDYTGTPLSKALSDLESSSPPTQIEEHG